MYPPRYGRWINGTGRSSPAGRATRVPPEQRRAAYAHQPIPRVAGPEEIARLVLFLASDDSSYCTGSAYLIVGGALATLRVPTQDTR